MEKTRAAELLEMAIKKYTGQERTVLDPTLELLQGLCAQLPEERIGFSNHPSQKRLRYVNKKQQDSLS